ncbi:MULTISPECIES: TetR/AcrR family transcriptional regulator [Brevibacillus]|uniref:TetR/AcrR family transcriptional regulator n=1 Tax=Brevibacillus invocatus TaxID=173959 RepID=A0A3M8C7H7_9BACL|nr:MULTISPECIES: TetR/AcrR family transcriptional regulator [Brevibacillus]MCM3078165.1 TetR/AcrR family transcriptional regulator [Brevibacillus invocatus]MCM3428250.1 TetR/AcrR family transcriptional regulator [Brevibacillus invocatus]MDH4617733.1 TetR/AcrR family transcriptional regulator [Brevibacillus sp. AY1]RNB71652.1 TetR/AcrR family transcriptional regulator [Brevibacillus invocatus]
MTKEKIKQAALELFSKHGYSGTTLAQIAEQVGIKTPSLFSHFKGKEELFVTIFHEVNWQIVEHVKRLAAERRGTSVKETLHKIFLRSCQFYLENEARTLFLKQTLILPPPFLQESIMDGFFHSEDALSAVLTEVLEQGIEEGVVCKRPVEQLIAAYYCMMDGILMQIHVYEPKQMEARITSIWEHFWRGLQAERCEGI